MDIYKRLQSKRSGSAMALVLIAVVMLLAMGSGLLSLSMQGQMRAIRTSSEIAARSAADAGLVKAVYQMNEKLKVQPWDDNTLPLETDAALSNCDAVFNYTITGDTASGFTVQSVGRSGRVQKNVTSTLRLQGLFESAILVQENIILKVGTTVDGYNSDDPTDTDVEVEIATCSGDSGSILLGAGSTVDGDIMTGVDPYLPLVSPPDLPDMGMGLYAYGITLTIGPGDSGKYTEIDVKLQNSVVGILEITGGDVVLYITGDIHLGSDCEILIRPGSSLTIYLDGNFIAANNAGVNNESDNPPSAFKLFGTGQDQIIDLKAKSASLGVIYAPNADIIVRADGDVYGSFVSANFELKNGGNLYYDEALQDVSVSDVGARFCVDRWREE